MSERRFVLVDFTHMNRAGCLRLYEAGQTYALPRAIAHAATKRELVAKQRPPGWVPADRDYDRFEHLWRPRLHDRGRADRRCWLTSLYPRAPLRDNLSATSQLRMHPHRLAVAALLVAMFPASAQVSDRMKATAPEKMMPSEKVQKMRECQERAKQQKIGMADRARFVDECVAAKAK